MCFLRALGAAAGVGAEVTPSTRHPERYTLNPTPCTLNPKPYTLNVAPQVAQELVLALSTGADAVPLCGGSGVQMASIGPAMAALEVLSASDSGVGVRVGTFIKMPQVHPLTLVLSHSLTLSHSPLLSFTLITLCNSQSVSSLSVACTISHCSLPLSPCLFYSRSLSLCLTLSHSPLLSLTLTLTHAGGEP